MIMIRFHLPITFLYIQAALTVLGIPVADVLRILSAVLLLGNICFTDGPDSRPLLRGEQELQSVASLLGLTPISLRTGLTTIMQRVRMHKISSVADASAANSIRDALAEALYARTITAVVRRINCASRRTPQTSTINATTTSDSSQDSSGMKQNFNSLNSNFNTCFPNGFFITSIQNKAFRTEKFPLLPPLLACWIFRVSRISAPIQQPNCPRTSVPNRFNISTLLTFSLNREGLV